MKTKHTKFDLIYKGVKLNRKPMTKEQAQEEAGLIIINYGYKPEIIQSLTK